MSGYSNGGEKEKLSKTEQELEVQDMLVVDCAGGCGNKITIAAVDRAAVVVLKLTVLCSKCQVQTNYKPDNEKAKRYERWVPGQKTLKTFEADDDDDGSE